nr:hypothetical protein [uncultured Moellerella sp.]
MSGFFNAIKSMAKAVVESDIFKALAKQALNLAEEVGMHLLKELKNKIMAKFVPEVAKKEGVALPVKDVVGATDALVNQMNVMKTPKEAGISAASPLNTVGGLTNVTPLLAVK